MCHSHSQRLEARIGRGGQQQKALIDMDLVELTGFSLRQRGESVPSLRSGFINDVLNVVCSRWFKASSLCNG